MSKSNITTIEDKNGAVWTGKVVKVDNHLGLDIISTLLFPVPLAAMPRSEPTVTVEVNGEKHSGHRAK